MGVTTTKTNKPLNPRGNDQSPLAYNRAKLYSGKALDFDGVNDKITTSLALTNDEVSVSFYLNWDDVGTQTIGFICEGSANDKMMIHTGASGAGVNGLQIAINVTNYSVPQIISEGWNHYLITSDRTNLNIYKNGVLFDSRTTDAGAIDITALTLGVRPIGSAYALDGQLSNFKVYSTALTAAQVADLYNNPEKVVPTGVDNTALKLWLPMMEGAGTTAYDGSGNSNHGTISGATYVNGVGAPVAQSAVMDWNKGSNYYPNSNDFSQWAPKSGTFAQGEADPFGGNEAWSLTATNTDPYIYQTISTAGDYTLSFWAKGIGSTIGKDFLLAVPGTDGSFTLTSEWVRYEHSFTLSVAAIVGFEIPNPAVAGDVVHIFGAQVNEGSTAGPYIPTLSTPQTSPILLPQGLTTGRDITGVNLFENVRKQGALNLDGNSWAEVHDNESLDITSAVSVEAWVYWGDEGVSDGIIGKGGDYLLYVSASKYVQFYLNGSYGTNQYLLGTNIGWYHVAGTYDGASQKIYVNGSLEYTQATTGSINSTNKVLDIGRYNSSSGTEYTNQIAQPRIYNRALTAEEVQRSYDSGKNIYTNS